MKTHWTLKAIAICLMSFAVNAQNGNDDSIKNLDQEKKTIEASKKVNEDKLKLAKLENELAEKTKDVQKAAEKAQKSADENQKAAAQLTNNAQDKKLANKAKGLARTAERDAKSARKATEDQQKIEKDLQSLREEIAKNETELGSQSGTSGGSLNAGRSASQGSTQNYGNAPSAARVTMPIIRNDTMSGQGGVRAMTERVVESTYRNYPQQAGQPSIIINNIIVPSDYDRPGRNDNQGQQQPGRSVSEMEDYEDFKAWQQQRYAQRGNRSSGSQYRGRNDQAGYDDAEMAESTSGNTFKDRFAEKAPRKSGMWVIPMVGVHASDFQADFQDNEATGRAGWNAGLDFRIHMSRFFIQPGVHYFSSSIEFTEKDSIESAPLLDGPRIHSLKVPLMVGLYLTKATKGFFKMNVKGGIVGTYVMAVDKSNQVQFTKNNIEEYSYGVNAGLGLEFGFITIDLSHEWGMSPFLKSNDVKNNVLRATLGFKL